jgi:hypothetical protein
MYGYFDDPSQIKPAYDPGFEIACPYCKVELIASFTSPPVTISMMVADQPQRSYFYRAHRTCYENATDELRGAIETLPMFVDISSR